MDHAPTASTPRRKKPLDTVVKLAIGVLVSSFGLIWGGMYLSQPDRTIPPFSIGSQEGTAVAVHVPRSTSDAEIETLIERFRKIGRESRHFGSMKIRPTTPDDPTGRYSRMTVYIFTDEGLADAPMLHKFLTGDDKDARDWFRRDVRGLYRVTESEEEGRIGPLLDGPDSAATAAYSRQLFKGPIDLPSESKTQPETAP